jgi:hypothetical protein
LSQPLDGKSMEFVIDQGQQLLRGLRHALLYRREYPRDVCH